MEAGEEFNINLKRQRAPLSDSEDNVFTSDIQDGQKRRRLEAAGQENRSPKPSSSGYRAELEIKPDTPIVPSVRSRVQQLTQMRRDGGAPLAQRCLSDPGTDSPSVIHGKEHLLGEREFHQRLERFKAPVFQASPVPALSPTNPCPRMCSNFVSGIQQKLQSTTTPSSKNASRIREERKQELSLLQPITENAWLKRSNSDPSLNQGDGSAEMKDGSFTETLASGAEKQTSEGTGDMTPCDSDTPAASVELKNSTEVQPQMQWKEQNTCEEIRKEEVGSKGTLPVSEQSRTVLKLSFSEDQSFSVGPSAEGQHVSELPPGVEQSMKEAGEQLSKGTEQGQSEEFSMEEAEESDDVTHSEEEMEPTTDEELRLWRYPQEEEESDIAEEQRESVCSSVEKEAEAPGCEPSDVQDGECYSNNVPEEMTSSSERLEDDKPQPEENEPESSSEDSASRVHTESPEGAESMDYNNMEDSGPCPGKDGNCQPSNEINIEEHNMDLEADRQSIKSTTSQTEVRFVADVGQTLKETQGEHTETETNVDKGQKPEVQVESSQSDGRDEAQTVTESGFLMTDDIEIERDASDKRQETRDGQTETGGLHKAEAGENSKKVSFILEPELISDVSAEPRPETSLSDPELSSHDETNTAEVIDQMFEEVLEYAERVEEEKLADGLNAEDHDSGISTCSGDKEKKDTEMEEESRSRERQAEEDKSEKLECNGDDLLTFPPSGILSPLSKSVEAVVTPMRLAVNQESNPPSLLLTPEDASTPPTESAPLYSVDAYRTQRQSKQPAVQSVTPGLQRRAPEKSQPQSSVNTKEKIIALNDEAVKLQTVINQTLQALSCCTDEEHGRGSLEEAEAEKLLLVSCEKRSALLAEVARLREERSSESAEAADEAVCQQPCRGTVGITSIQLPLKVEFVYSSHNRAGRPSHYFFVLIRYGPCNIVATPLATAADAQNGDTISFPTSVTLKDIRSSFEIDVEVYSLSHTSGSSSSMDRTTTKSRVTPRKLLNTITRSSNSLMTAAPALSTRRSSNFCLVGSHKITLASLGHSKFPLDKMKLEGKIRRLLGDEFQEKVPFLSPLEGNIYLQLDSQSHSSVQHQGFLTMFELISGYGVWHRRYFVLEGCNMHYWNHPNDRETKESEGNVSLSRSRSQSVRPVKRDSCARPFTFELVNSVQLQSEGSQEPSAKCWFSADTKQERLDWMEKLNQALLDFHTWNRKSGEAARETSDVSGAGNLRESIL